MTIAFEFAFESHMQEHVASMARQYVRSIISSVQKVALTLSPSHLSSHARPSGHHWALLKHKPLLIGSATVTGATWVWSYSNLTTRGMNLC